MIWVYVVQHGEEGLVAPLRGLTNILPIAPPGQREQPIYLRCCHAVANAPTLNFPSSLPPSPFYSRRMWSDAKRC